MKLLNLLLFILLVGATSAHAQTASQWIKYSSPEGKYKVLMPGQPTVKTNEATDGDGKPLLQHLATVSAGGGAFMVTYFDYPPESNFKMEAARDGLVKAVAGTIDVDEPITLAGVAGRAFTVRAKTEENLEFVDRAIILDADRRVYVIQCLFAKADDGPMVIEKCKHFSNSFSLATP